MSERVSDPAPSKTPKADASYAKLRELRESGYRGPVDEHGNKTTFEAWKRQHGLTP